MPSRSGGDNATEPVYVHGTGPGPCLRLPGIPADAHQLTRTRRLLVDWATATGLSRDHVNDLVLAAYEAMSNVVDHAYPDSTGTFDLRGDHADHRVTVTVADHGRWKPATTTPALLPALRGRGLTLMKGLSDEFELVHDDTGTRVRMTFHHLGT